MALTIRTMALLSLGVASAASAQNSTPALQSRAGPSQPVETVRPVPVPPPIMTIAAPRNLAPSLLAVELLGAGTVLWSGQLRLGDYTASYSSTVNDMPEPCPADKSGRARYSNINRSLSVNLSRGNYGVVDEYLVSAQWTRAAPGCEAGTGTVGLNRKIVLKPGQKIELAGDGGFLVRLTRID